MDRGGRPFTPPAPGLAPIGEMHVSVHRDDFFVFEHITIVNEDKFGKVNPSALFQMHFYEAKQEVRPKTSSVSKSLTFPVRLVQ